MEAKGAMLAQKMAGVLDHVVECLDGLDADALNWRPPAPDTNSLYVIATHVLGNVEESIFQILGGRDVGRRRDREFVAEGPDAQVITQRWQRLRSELQDAIAALTADDLERTYQHPRRGALTGHEVLLLVITHASEHLGEAQLTRMLALAR